MKYFIFLFSIVAWGSLGLIYRKGRCRDLERGEQRR